MRICFIQYTIYLFNHTVIHKHDGFLMKIMFIKGSSYETFTLLRSLEGVYFNGFSCSDHREELWRLRLYRLSSRCSKQSCSLHPIRWSLRIAVSCWAEAVIDGRNRFNITLPYQQTFSVLTFNFHSLQPEISLILPVCYPKNKVSCCHCLQSGKPFLRILCVQKFKHIHFQISQHLKYHNGWWLCDTILNTEEWNTRQSCWTWPAAAHALRSRDPSIT